MFPIFHVNITIMAAATMAHGAAMAAGSNMMTFSSFAYSTKNTIVTNGALTVWSNFMV